MKCEHCKQDKPRKEIMTTDDDMFTEEKYLCQSCYLHHVNHCQNCDFGFYEHKLINGLCACCINKKNAAREWSKL